MKLCSQVIFAKYYLLPLDTLKRHIISPVQTEVITKVKLFLFFFFTKTYVTAI